MKKIKILLIIVISFFISVTNCFAQEIDVNKICSITGKYNYSDVSISDTKIYLYRIADISNIAKYTYVSDFSSFDIDINGLANTEWNNYAKELSKYIDNKNIKYIDDVVTDSTGKFTFSNMKTGLYLLKADSKKTKDYEYSSGPVLISLPNYNEIDEVFMYDLSVAMKTEAKSLNVNPGNTTNVPNTFDPLYLYILLFGASLIIFIICYICIKKSKKK